MKLLYTVFVKNKALLIILIILASLLFVEIKNLGNKSLSPEFSLINNSTSFWGKGKAIAASCGFTLHGSPDEFTSCNYTCPNSVVVTGVSQCGGACGLPSGQTCPSCTNGATNPPVCDTCATGSTMQSGQCVCNNGATNAPSCSNCGAGMTLRNNLCVCANGATNPTQCNTCPSGSTMQSGQCVCANGGSPQSSCLECNTGDVMYQGQCKPGCSLTNVCGQTSQGVLINGVCSTANGTNINNSCITTFTASSDSVNPNGSVEFSWKIPNLPANITPNCGFVDLTTPTPRPIPGLQNLNPTTDRVRINNIQTTTRFCLICQFTKNNTSLGEAVVHQWVRVIRIGEE